MENECVTMVDLGRLYVLRLLLDKRWLGSQVDVARTLASYFLVCCSMFADGSALILSWLQKQGGEMWL